MKEKYKIDRLREALNAADAIVVGAGAGLSASAGFVYDGERFRRHFADFEKAYRFHDMYAGGFYPYATPEEYWAYWSRYIYWNRYDQPAGRPYRRLLEVLQDREYFVITTNVDHQFQLAGFDKKRLFYTQGDYGLWQCTVPCHDATYDNEETVRRMVTEQRERRIPSSLLPYCPICGAPMTMNLRCDASFVEDAGWHAARAQYGAFLHRFQGRRVLFWELGVGGNTPGIIKYPFWHMTAANPQAIYACVNLGEAICPEDIGPQAICMAADAGEVLERL